MANYRGGMTLAKKVAFKEMQDEFNSLKNDISIVREWDYECSSELDRYSYFYAGMTDHINIDYVTPYYLTKVFINVTKLNRQIGL